MPGEWGADPPEINSAGFWCGPGASSFEAAAAELTALSAAIIALLGGDEAVAAALGFAWPAPTGDMAILANVPHLLWQASSAGMLGEAAAQIQATAAAFESLKAATPTPVEVETNQTTHVALNAANFLGMLTPLIIANRAQYFGDYWVRSASNKYAYGAASATGVQAIPPLPPPAQTAMPMGGDQGQGQAASDPMQQAMQMPMQMMQMPMQMLGQMGGQFGQLAGMGQQFMSPLMSMSSMSSSSGVGAPAGALDGAAGGWAGAAPLAGGPVSASLAAGGFGGGGVSGASSALRGPVSWSSATVPTTEAPVTRLAAAETSVSTAPAGVGGGAMMGPMAARAAAESNERGDEAKSMALLSAAILYRAPASVPVVTGGAGAMLGREALN